MPFDVVPFCGLTVTFIAVAPFHPLIVPICVLSTLEPDGKLARDELNFNTKRFPTFLASQPFSEDSVT